MTYVETKETLVAIIVFVSWYALLIVWYSYLITFLQMNTEPLRVIYSPTHPAIRVVDKDEWEETDQPIASNVDGIWHYNYEAALMEAIHLNARIPNRFEFEQLYGTGWKPTVSMKDSTASRWVSGNDIMYFWTSSKSNKGNPYIALFIWSHININIYDKRLWIPLMVIV